jgi:hypothetical protein
MIKKLKKQRQKRQALRTIRYDFKEFKNSVIIEKIHETRHLNNNAIEIRT